MMDTNSWAQLGGGGVVNSSPPEACSTGAEGGVRSVTPVGSRSYSTRLKYTLLLMNVFFSRSWLHFVMSRWTSFSLWPETGEWQRCGHSILDSKGRTGLSCWSLCLYARSSRLEIWSALPEGRVGDVCAAVVPCAFTSGRYVNMLVIFCRPPLELKAASAWAFSKLLIISRSSSVASALSACCGM